MNNTVEQVSEKLFIIMPQVKSKFLNLQEISKDCVIPPSHLHVIILILQSGPMPVSEIAYKLGISRPNMTPIVQNLIKLGFITKEHDSKDKRVTKVHLTSKAINLLDLQKEKILRSFEKKFQTLTEQDLCELNNCLDKLLTIISKI